MSNTIVTISTAQELYAALKNATGGETINLRPGDYGLLKFNTTATADFDFPSNVTIASENPDNPATISGLHMNYASNITFDGITFDYTFTATDKVWQNEFYVKFSTDITFKNSIFDGDLASGISATDDGYGYGVGLMIRDSVGVTVQDSEFFNWYRAALTSQSQDVTMTGNEIHSIRSDGFDFAEVQNVLVENNYFHDFKQAPGSPDHLDMIQVWTTSTDSPTVGLTIRGNILDIGEGTETQSIFMRNGNVDTGIDGYEMYYRDIVIEDNTIYNAHLHGITVGETDGLIIRNNTLIKAEGANELGDNALYTPAINVSVDALNVNVSGNITGNEKISGYTGQAGWVVKNNAFIQDVDATEPGFYQDVFVMSSMTDDNGVHRFKLLPDSFVSDMNAGSGAVQFDANPGVVVPLYHVYSRNDAPNVLVFDGSLTAGPGGKVDPANAEFIWDFDDGTTATGPLVQRKFDDPGFYNVTLTVKTADGSTSVSEYEVGIAGDDLISLDTATGKFVNGQYGEINPVDATIDTLFQAGAKVSIKMGGTGTKATVSHKDMSTLFGADEYTLAFSLQGTAGMASAGEVFRSHGNFVVKIDAKGNLYFQTFPVDGTYPTVMTTGVNLIDGQLHNVTIRYEGAQDTFNIWVDGTLNTSLKIGADLPYYPRDLTFGNPWGSTDNFTGLISKFEIHSEQAEYSKFIGKASDINTTVTEDHTSTLPPAGAAPVSLELDIASLSGETDAMRGDVSVVDTADGSLLRFDGDRDAFKLGKIDEVANADALTVSIDFSRATADGSSANMFFNTKHLLLKLVDDGITVRAATQDEGFKGFRINDLGLNDTDTHNAVIMIDSQSDRMQVLIDGILVLDETQTDFSVDGGGNWVLGSTKARFFEGDISGFSVDASVDFVDEPLAFADDGALF